MVAAVFHSPLEAIAPPATSHASPIGKAMSPPKTEAPAAPAAVSARRADVERVYSGAVPADDPVLVALADAVKTARTSASPISAFLGETV